MTEPEKRGPSAEDEGDLKSTLEDLREYRKRNPGFERVIAEIVEAETTANEDPAEGRVLPQTPPKSCRSRS